MAIIGDTVRFQVGFKGFDGNTIADTPDTVHFKLYDSKRLELFTVTLDDTNKTSTGYYHYDLTFGDEYVEGIYTFEFKGIFNEVSYISRDEITLTFS